MESVEEEEKEEKINKFHICSFKEKIISQFGNLLKKKLKKKNLIPPFL
jgi:hypothetical protein